METPDLSTLSDNIDSTDDLVPSLQVFYLNFYFKYHIYAQKKRDHIVNFILGVMSVFVIQGVYIYLLWKCPM